MKIKEGSRVRILRLSTAGYGNPKDYVGKEGTVESTYCGAVWVHIDGEEYKMYGDPLSGYVKDYGYQFEIEDLELL